MRRNDFLEIKNLSLGALVKKAQSLRSEIADLVMDKNMNKLKDVKSIAKKKKDLAQVLTVLRQKELVKDLEAKKG